MKQKKVALINDITGFGRCSITIELPILSALKIEASPFPTAVLSVHTGFPSYFMNDYTENMQSYMESWEKNNLEFDGILTGFFGSKEQIDIAIDFIKRFRRKDTLVMIDPVMGDHGKRYASYTEEMCVEMRKLLSYADVIAPNLTEATELLGVPYPKNGEITEDELLNLAKRLNEKGPKRIVITGLREKDVIKNFIYEENIGSKIISTKAIGGDRSGTGDAFSAIVMGSLMNGEGLHFATQKAADFINKAVKFAEDLNLPWNYGLPFEEYLTELR